jgi:hypothetical protein
VAGRATIRDDQGEAFSVIAAQPEIEWGVAAGKKRKTMIVALARKLLIALWRFLITGEVPEGVVLRPIP